MNIYSYERRDIMKKKFKCEVDCANCALKLENALKKVKGVEDVSVNFLTQKLVLTAPDEDFDSVFLRNTRNTSDFHVVSFQCIVDDLCHIRIYTDSRYVVQVWILVNKRVHIFGKLHDAFFRVCALQ